MNRTKDLTEGNIKTQLIALALPLVMGSILQQLYNTIDAVIIGRYAGNEAFAAIGVAGTIMNLFIFILNGCCSGISVIFAQFYGEKSIDKFRRESYLSIVFGTLFTVILSIVGVLFINILLGIINTPLGVKVQAAAYLKIIFYGLIATFLYNLFAGTLRAVGNTKVPLIILMFSMLLNIILDILFIVSFNLGTEGAALATVISQLISAVLCFIYLKHKLSYLVFTKQDMKFDSKLLGRTFKYGIV